MSASLQLDITEAFGLIMELAVHDDIPTFAAAPRLWERVLDDQWTFAFNGARKPVEWQGMTVEPLTACITFNGWLAGVLDPFGGVIAAGALANEDTFIAALRVAVTA